MEAIDNYVPSPCYFDDILGELAFDRWKLAYITLKEIMSLFQTRTEFVLQMQLINRSDYLPLNMNSRITFS